MVTWAYKENGDLDLGSYKIYNGCTLQAKKIIVGEFDIFKNSTFSATEDINIEYETNFSNNTLTAKNLNIGSGNNFTKAILKANKDINIKGMENDFTQAKLDAKNNILIFRAHNNFTEARLTSSHLRDQAKVNFYLNSRNLKKVKSSSFYCTDDNWEFHKHAKTYLCNGCWGNTSQIWKDAIFDGQQTNFIPRSKNQAGKGPRLAWRVNINHLCFYTPPEKKK